MRTVGKVAFAGVVLLCTGLLLAWVVYEWRAFAVATLLALPILAEMKWGLLRE